MSIERAKKRQQAAGADVAAIGRIKIEPSQSPEEIAEAVVEILGLQTRSLHALCLTMRDVLIALENRDPDTETGPDDEPPALGETELSQGAPGSEREPGAQTEPDPKTQLAGDPAGGDPPAGDPPGGASDEVEPAGDPGDPPGK